MNIHHKLGILILYECCFEQKGVDEMLLLVITGGEGAGQDQQYRQGILTCAHPTLNLDLPLSVQAPCGDK